MTAQGAAGYGRFAPSPTGPLHMGSLMAAAASYLDARSAGVGWQVRIDDLDAPRNQPGAESAILTALERHGLLWDGPVVRQSDRLAHYEAALDALAKQGLLFYCHCSRRELADTEVYPGTCRGRARYRRHCAIRVRVDSEVVEYQDLLQGAQREALAQVSGDFVVKRKDGIVAYQLATAVDDGSDAITRVIRGRDLLETTPRQLFLMQRLGLKKPLYGHIPLLRNRAGQKLSKQAHATPLDHGRAAENLTFVLTALGAQPQATGSSCGELLAQACVDFSLRQVPAHDTVLDS